MTSTSPLRGKPEGERIRNERNPDSFVRLMMTIVLISSFSIAFGLWERNARPAHTPDQGSTLPRSGGPELVAIYIGSSFCAGSSLPDFPRVEHRTFAALATYAMHKRMRFVRIGVSVDASADIGRDYLKRFGPFDTISVGGGWLNPLAISYIWRDQPATGTIPQIVVIQRQVKLTQSGPLLAPDSLLGRLVGMNGMEEWLRRHSD